MLTKDIENRPDWIQLKQIIQNQKLGLGKKYDNKELGSIQSPRRTVELETIKSSGES